MNEIVCATGVDLLMDYLRRGAAGTARGADAHAAAIRDAPRRVWPRHAASCAKLTASARRPMSKRRSGLPARGQTPSIALTVEALTPVQAARRSRNDLAIGIMIFWSRRIRCLPANRYPVLVMWSPILMSSVPAAAGHPVGLGPPTPVGSVSDEMSRRPHQVGPLPD
jgi:hypothetical protein